jgi:hypothetical protein
MLPFGKQQKLLTPQATRHSYFGFIGRWGSYVLSFSLEPGITETLDCAKFKLIHRQATATHISI